MNQKEDYHVHSNYNDHSSHDMSIENVIKRGKEIGLQKIAITEHVRKTSSWVRDYLKELELHSKVGGGNLDIISGFEAKILADGTLDCLDEYLENYFIIASFHTKYDKTLWLELIQKVVQNPRVDVVGHLGPDSTWPVPLDMDELKMTASMIARHGKIIELNAKYHRPPREWLHVFKQQGISFHLASDAHSLDEIGQYQGISDLVAIVDDGGKSEIENDFGRKSLS